MPIKQPIEQNFQAWFNMDLQKRFDVRYPKVPRNAKGRFISKDKAKV